MVIKFLKKLVKIITKDVPSMESRNESDVQVVLELVDGTEPSVELGPNPRVTVTIISADIIVCSILTGELFSNSILL